MSAQTVRAALRWHADSLRYWLKERRCDLMGHRDLVATPHSAGCYRPAHEGYPDDVACHYCQRWVEQ